MAQLEQRGDGVIFNAPIDLILGETQVVQPDLLVVRSSRKAIATERGVGSRFLA
jgi:hypothetical protein